MNKRNIIIFGLLICIIMSVSAVSAADIDFNNTDDINSHVLTINQNSDSDYGVSNDVNDLDTYSSTQNNTILTADGDTGSFSDLQKLINDDTTGSIILDRNYAYDSSTDSSNGIVISKSITIDGSGKYVLNANNQARILRVIDGDNVVLKGITFVNANVERYNGGSIYWAGTDEGILKISDSTFINSTAGGDGGSIFAGGDIEIDNTTFINSSGRYGGSIYGSDMIITNSRFINSTSLTSGGSIYTDANIFKLDNINVTGGHAGDMGGAIAMEYETGNNQIFTDVTLYNILITNTSASTEGGAILIDGPEANLINITIDNCSADYGGGIFFREPVLKFTNLTLTNNHADTDGGAIYYEPLYGGTLNHEDGLNNAIFINNTADNNGGAVYLYADIGKINNALFLNNTAGNSGGAMMVTGSNWNINDVIFTNNTATNGRGGAAYLEDNSNSSFSNCNFTNNTAGTNGGALDWHEGAHDGIVSNSNFINNTAKRSGGAVYWSGTNGTIKNSNFTNNKATGEVTDDIGGGDGGSILWIGKEGYVDNCLFINNFAQYRGGAAFLKNNDNGIFNNSYFENNTAGLNGGALDWQSGANNGIVNNCVFINNTAWRSAGAVYWSGTNGVIANSTFKYNNVTGNVTVHDKGIVTYLTSGGNGGAVVWMGSKGLVDNCTFIDNEASARGGAIYLQNNHNTTVQYSKFIENTAGTNGGAVDWYKGSSDGQVLNSIFERNVAKRSGGAIYWYGHNGIVANSNFTNNTALGLTESEDSYGVITTGGDGGAIIWTGTQGTVSNSRFINNTAPYRGGAVFLQGGSVEDCTNTSFLNSYFENNHAGLNGGAVDWSKGAHNGLVDNCTFIKNYADRSAGAIYWSGTEGIVANSTFKHNYVVGNVSKDDRGVTNYSTAGGNGGAIVWMGSIGLIHNTTFYNNTATARGGAVYLQNNEKTTVQYSNFTENIAGLNGGAVDWYAGAIDGVVNYCNFNDNIANRSGGAIYWYGHNGTVSNSNFTHNIAQGIKDGPSSSGINHTGGDGGAIIWTGGEGIVDNCSFTDNFAPYRGGAVYLQGGSEDCYNTTFKNSYFKNNTAGLNGGAVDWSNGAHEGKIDNCTFIENTAWRSAGAVYWSGTNGTVINSRFINNTVVGNVTKDKRGVVIYATNGGNGGAIVWMGSIGLIDNSTFIQNNASSRGGAVYLQNNANGTIQNSNFTKNYAGTNGGAVDWFKGAVNGTLDNCLFIDNTAKRSGGAVYWYGEYGIVINSNFTNNTALGKAPIDNPFDPANVYGGDGGAIIWTGSYGELDNCYFFNNSAVHRGGAIFLQNNSYGLFNNSYFENNTAGTNGGAIDWYEGAVNGAIYNSKFINNTAVNEGGAIFWNGYNGTIQNSYFDDNDVTGDSSYGGAVCWTGSEGLIKNTIFYNNTAKLNGGAINFRDNVNGTIDNCTFEYNFANQDGGALYWRQGASNGNVSNSKFINNTAKRNAGAIEWQGDNGTVYNSTFKDNTALGTTVTVNRVLIPGGRGGAIYWIGNDGIINQSSFDNDKSNEEGSAVYVAGSNLGIVYSNFTNHYTNMSGTVYINGEGTDLENCVFDNNTAKIAGGAVYWASDSYYDKIIDSNFTNNRALGGNGGAVYWGSNGNYGSIIGSNFENNTAVGVAGAVYWAYSSNGNVENCTFIGNNATGNGGALYWNGQNGILNNTKFINNYTAGAQGHGNFAGGGAVVWSATNGIFYKCTFENNTCPVHAGAVYGFQSNNLTVNYCNFTNNNCSAGIGGVFYLESASNIRFLNSNFKNNYARTDSGVLYFNRGCDYANVTNCTFDGNNARQAGAVYWNVNHGFIENSTFINNYISVPGTSGADNHGGAIIFAGSDNIIRNSRFINNSIDSSKLSSVNEAYGGAVFYSASNSKIIACNFTDNLAKFGGAIFTNVQKVNITGSIFINNYAEDNGGAISLDKKNSASPNSYIDNCIFIANGADFGGAIRIHKESTGITVSNSIFEDNYANARGGAIRWGSADGNLFNCNFTNHTVYVTKNRESPQGGTIYIDASNCNIHDLNIDMSSATHMGGAIYIVESGSGNKLYNITITNSFSKNNGGAIAVRGSNNTVDGITIINSTASGNGGGIYVEGNNQKILNSNIINSTAVNGGGIYVSTSTNINLTNVYIANSTATNNGGGIYFTGSNPKISNVTLFNNRAKYGGGVYWISSSDMVNMKLYNNTAVNGGGVYWATYANNAIINTTMQYNKADYGSALYYNVNNILDIKDSVILDNQALALRFEDITIHYTDNSLEISVILTGGDNLINAIYNNQANGAIYYTNVTYWGVTGAVNTGSNRITATKRNPDTGDEGIFQTLCESGQNITFTLFDKSNNVIVNVTNVTDISGKAIFKIEGEQLRSLSIRITHLEDNYYTLLSYATKNLTDVIIKTDNITFTENELANISIMAHNSTINTMPSGNITVYLDDDYYGNYTIAADGTVKLNISSLHAGIHKLRVQYHGDGNFLPEFNETTFYVKPIEGTVKINITDYDYGNTGKAIISVPEYVTGEVNITINGKTYTIIVANEKNITLDFEILNVGNYTAKVSYNASNDYTKAENTTDFNVVKVNSTISISIEYGKITTITVEVGEYNITGNVTIAIDGYEPQNVILENSKGSVKITDLPIGNHTVNATYYGDINHYASFNKTSFEAIKFDTPINVDAENMTYGESQTITITLPEDVTGNVTVTFNNKTLEYPITGGKVQFTASDLSVGHYLIKVVYDGDDNYNRNNVTAGFYVTPITPDLEADVENITYNLTEEHLTAYINQTGNVTVKIFTEDSVLYIENPEILIENNKITWNISDLPAGVYIAEFTYNGNQNYSSTSINKTFEVYKAQTNITFTITDLKVGKTTVINITVNSTKATGEITVILDGDLFTVKLNNGTASFNRTNFTYGNHSIISVYDGDNNYTGNWSLTKFFIDYATGYLNVKAQNIAADKTEIITVEVPDDATGYVLLNVNGTGYYIDLAKGERSISIPNLNTGNYHINATLIGDNKYGTVKNTTDFKVSKLNATITINVLNVTYDSNANITITLSDNVTGNITIKLNDADYGSFTIINNTVNLIIPGLSADIYSITATYNGDSKHNTNATSKLFEVYRATPTITISVSESEAGKTATVTFTINSTATGNLTGTVAGKAFNEEIIDGKVTVITDILENKTYSIEVNYIGDKNYTSAENSTTFNVPKTSDYELNITAGDINVGDLTNITVNVPSDAEGIVIININGTNYTANIKDGKAVFHNQTNLKSGKYTVTAYFGDDKYSNKTATGVFIVNKVQTPVTVQVNPTVYAGDKAIITVTVPDDTADNITIEIDGKKYNKTTDSNGKAVFEITGLTSGNKTVTVVYNGDDKYLFNSTTANFTVIKRTSQVNVTATGDYVGDNAVITVKVTQNATGYVIVNVDGTEYAVNLTDSHGSVTIPNLLNGTYNVNVTYLGDEIYESSTNKTSFNLSKQNMTLSIELENITYGETEYINITGFKDATGNVTVKINNNVFENIPIINGIVKLPVTDLAGGNYTVNVIYNGDNKYNKTAISGNFTVKKSEIKIEVITQNITYTQKETITVYINATGNVTLKIDDEIVDDAKIIENGIAVFEIENIPAKVNYTVEVIYNGNNNYTQSVLTQNFTVNKKDPRITVDVSDIPYGNYETITVHVNASGNVTIKVAGISETIELNNGIKTRTLLMTASWPAIVEYDGKATLNIYALAAGTYPVEVTYNGNENYNIITATAQFTVYQTNTTLTVEVEDIPVWNKEFINITLNENTTGKVIININGINYTAEIINGKGQLNLSNLTAGEKTVWVFYDGDNNFTANRTMKTFTVTPRTPEINVTGVNITVGESEKLTVKVPLNATGFIKITVDNHNYIEEITGGELIFILNDLKEGIYPVTVTYLPYGNENYTQNSNSTTFKVTKANSTITIIVNNVTYNGNINITVKVPNNATGNITIRINNTDYGPFLVINGEVNLTVPDLKADIYNVTATYNGNSYYNTNTTSKLFEVYRATPVITINIGESEAGKTATVTFTINSTATGNLTGTVAGKTFNEAIVDGKVTIITDILENKTYTIEVNYVGDKNYTSAENSATFTVPKTSDYELNITAADINVGDLTEITVNVPADSGGIVIINIGGTNYTAVIDNGKAVFRNETGLGAGKYNVTAYFGDGKYANKTAEGSFTISKVQTPISINVNDSYVRDTVKVIVTLPVDVDGEVNIKVNGQTYTNTTVDGNATFYITKLNSGNKTVTAVYNGDDKYLFNSTTANFTVSKRQSHVNVTATGDYVGNNAVISVKVLQNATGYVIVNVNGTEYSINLTDGTGSVEIPNLGNGTYSINATYLGDEQYLSSTNNTASFEMIKNTPEINITVANVIYGNKTVIIMDVGNATGNIEIIINETSKGIFPIVNGKVEFDAGILASDNYTVSVKYSGDDKYINSEADKDFKVSKAVPVITVEYESVKSDENATITVHITDATTGNVTITVNGKDYNATVENGTAKVTIDQLPVSEYDVTVRYAGDKNFTNALNTFDNSLKVIKTDNYNLNITAGDINVGDLTNITVNVPVDSEGIVIININGINYTAVIDNGKAVFRNETGLGAGKYNVTAYFTDNKYANKTAEGVFTISKVQTPITVEVNPIYVGDKAIVQVTVPRDVSGNITIEIDGKKYNKTVTDGMVVFEISDLIHGNKTVTAVYNGDDKYLFNSTTANFTVSKRQSQINVTATGNTVGGNATVTIEIAANATGYVIVNVNGTNYTINITNKDYSIEIPNLSNGTYSVNVTYIGDEQYLSSTNSTLFSISKIQSEITVEVEEGHIIPGGSDVNLIIRGPEDANGIVNITVESTGLDTVTLPTYMYNGVATLHIEKPIVGYYNILANFTGDKKYLSSKNNTYYEVYATGNNLTVKTRDIDYKNEERIHVDLTTGKYDGNVTVTVLDEDGNIVYNENITTVYDPVRNITHINATFTPPHAGKYSVEAIYIEVNGSKTIEHIGENTFEVYKLNSTVTIKPINDSKVGEKVLIEISVEPADATGEVSVFINGERHVLNMTNLTLLLTGLTEDEYIVDVFYIGDINYNSSDNVTTFKVFKHNSTLTVSTADIKVGQTEQINITLPDNATGYVLINVNGISYYSNITDSSAQINIANLKEGKYNVTVTYLGDDYYYSSTANKTFTVSKTQPSITVKPEDITYGESEVITVETDENITDVITLTINNKNYTGFITNGKGNITIHDLAAGEYDVEVYFNGNDKYLKANSTAAFNVNKTETGIIIIPQNITYGEKETVTVYVDGTGTVNITIGDFKDTVDIINGEVTYEVPGFLTAGNYTVNITYNGNDNYTVSSAEVNFTVYKADSKIIIRAENITYDETEHILVNVNATGNVTVRINNITVNEIILKEDNIQPVILKAILDAIETYNGKAAVEAHDLNAGVYIVTATYNGNENYNPSTNKTVFIVYKHNTTVSVNVSDIRTDQSEIINITLNKNITGKVTVNVDGVNTTVNIINGTGNLTLNSLANKTHSVVVIYEGDNNYNGNWTSATFNVSKVTPTLTIEVTNRTVGEIELVTIHLPKNATGYVVVNVDGVKYHVDIVEGEEITLEIPNLTNKTYNVKATYSGDDYYDSAENTTSFNVGKIKSTVKVTAENITVGENVVININVSEDATGNITVKIGNITETVAIVNGTAKAIIPDLKVGDKTVEVTYSGDGKYLGNTNKTVFNVAKIKNTPIKVIDLGNGTVAVTVPENATGNITVKIGNETYEAGIVNGTCVITLDNATPGKHDITVIYSGDENRTENTVNSNVNIPKLETPVNVNVSDIKVGDVEVIKVTLPENATGNVTVEIDGILYEPVKFENGIVQFNITDLTSGNKTAVIRYSGDDNYLNNISTVNFNVSKRESFVTPSVEAIDVGDNAVLNITVPGNATGYVIVEVNNQSYAVKITNGTGSVEIQGLANGTHEIKLTYPGDNQYLPSNTTTEITVSKVPSTLNVNAENITVGDKEVITVNVPRDICGNVTVSVNGTNYTVYVSNGQGTLVIPGLKHGDYTVDAVFDGCKKYEASENSTGFTVSKIKPDIKVIDQGNNTVVITVPNDTTGNITVTIDNETYTGTIVNGTCVITLDNATPGKHNITVTYSGDENHTNGNVNSQINSPKTDTPITADAENIKIGDNEKITVNVPEDATGNITIEIDGVKYTQPVENGKTTFEIANLTNGQKTVTVSYSGDDNYNPNYTTAQFTVGKRNSTVSVTVGDIDVGDKAIVHVTVPDNATGTVLIDINGVGYYANVTDGKGTAEIPRLLNGTYDVTVTYNGDEQYLPSSNKTTFEVSKVPSYVIPNAINITVGENEVLYFRVNDDATGILTVSIGGDDYKFNLDDDTLGSVSDGEMVLTVSISEGEGVIVISGLPKGEYTVGVTYEGDEKYMASSNSTVFTVSKLNSTINITDKGNGTVIVDVLHNETGNITLNVNGNTYTAPIINGSATFDLSNETPGKHDVTAVYGGDNKYYPTTADSTVNIPKHETPLDVSSDDIYVGDDESITVKLPADATGNVTVEIDGVKYTSTIKDGEAVFSIPNLTSGNKTLTVTYSGDSKYLPNSTAAQFKVMKKSPAVIPFSKDIKAGDDETLTVTLPEDATGKVTVEINGVKYSADVINGKAKITVPGLSKGNYDVNVTYSGDDKYLPASNTTSFKVTKNPVPISSHDVDIKEGETAVIIVKLPSDATGTVTLKVNGKTYTAKVENGKAVFNIQDLPVGEYDAVISYSGDDKYEANSTSVHITVGGDDSNHEDTAHGSAGQHISEVNLNRHPTGNPILMLMLILLVLASTKLRKFKK